jgi:hypothetical protein
MLKKIAIAMALVIPTTASAEKRTYDVRAVEAANLGNYRSCHASDRMLRDRHVITVDDEAGTVIVDGFGWEVWGGVGMTGRLDLYFHFRDSEGLYQKTYLNIEAKYNDRKIIGKYWLLGELPGGKGCLNAVYFEGDRR